MENKRLLEKVKELALKREFSKIRDLINDVESVIVIAAIADVLGSTFIGTPITSISVILLREILNSRQTKLYLDYLFNYQQTNPAYFYRLSDYFFIIEDDYNFDTSNKLEEELTQIIRRKYGEEIEIQIFIQEGSIKAKIILYGTIIFLGIGNYGSFRSGLRDIKNDLDYFATEIKHIIEEFGYDIREYDGRVGFPAELENLIKNIEEIESTGGILNQEEKENLGKLKQRLANLLTIVHKDERALIMETLKSTKLPQPQREGVRMYSKMFAIREEEEI